MEYITQRWSDNKDQLPQDIKTYWTFRDDMAVIDNVVIKGQCIVIPGSLQQHALKHLHINHMGIEETKLLAHKSFYWMWMYADIENHIKRLFYMPSLSANTTKRENSTSQHPQQAHGSKGPDMFTLNNTNYLCIVD